MTSPPIPLSTEWRGGAKGGGEIAPTNMALKEWAVVCGALLRGEQVALVRKGGIHEPHRRLTIEHDAFFLYPNAEHQSAEQVKPAYRAALDAPVVPPAESSVVRLPGFCRVTDVLEVCEPARLRALEPLTCWTQALFDVRLAYKPERPNYVVVVRAYALPQPIETPYHKTYAGCRSWVPLKEALSPAGAIAALDDAAFQAARERVLAVLA